MFSPNMPRSPGSSRISPFSLEGWYSDGELLRLAAHLQLSARLRNHESSNLQYQTILFEILLRGRLQTLLDQGYGQFHQISR